MRTMKSFDPIRKRILSSEVFRRISLASGACAVAVVFVLAACSAPQPEKSNAEPQIGVDWKPVEQALGKAGSIQPGDVYKVSLPRSDLKVTVGVVEIKPALALGSWLAFKKNGDMTMVMGDLVLPRWSVFA